MTRNQIAYKELQEQRRHNYAMEFETNRANLAKEDATRVQNAETQRHNMVNENVEQRKVMETGRSNRAHESETNRHNVTVEAETMANNLRTWTEMKRHNESVESINQYANSLQASKIQNDYNIGLREVSEKTRHNMASEFNTEVSNHIQQQRADQDYDLGNRGITFDYDKLNEQNALWNSQQYGNYTKGTESIVDSVLNIGGFIPKVLNMQSQTAKNNISTIGSLFSLFK
nr:MAG: hypothetical protein [Jiangsu picobirnavirus 88]